MTTANDRVKAPARLVKQYPSEFNSWRGMSYRCTQPTNNEYHRYGAKGIRMCDRWARSFSAFLEDMGPKPTRKHTIDRKESSKGYYKSNCRWATKSEQNSNLSMYGNNTSGHTGVSKRHDRFTAYIGVSGRLVWLGTFTRFEDAVSAREAAEKEFGHVRHG